MRIEKAPETMTHKRRLQTMFTGEKPDRVPIGYDANPGVHARLMAALGVRDDEALLEAMGVDMRAVNAPYVGKPLFAGRPGRQVDPLKGYVTREVRHASGSYWDYCDFPLLGADDETIASYPVYDPDDFDYTAAGDAARALGDMGLYVGNPGVGCVINCLGMLMGMEEALVRLATGDEATMTLIRRQNEADAEIMARTIDACGGAVDFMWLGEDLGTQHCPLISMEMYRAAVKPFHQMFCDVANERGLPVLVHTCGSSSWVYEEFISMGIRGVDTLQPEADDMSPEYLVAHFGGRLAFRGGLSTGGAVAFGTPEETEAEVRRLLEVMMPTRMYQFAPSHALQDNSPTANVVAMYQAAHTYGVYR